VVFLARRMSAVPTQHHSGRTCLRRGNCGTSFEMAVDESCYVTSCRSTAVPYPMEALPALSWPACPGHLDYLLRALLSRSPDKPGDDSAVLFKLSRFNVSGRCCAGPVRLVTTAKP